MGQAMTHFLSLYLYCDIIEDYVNYEYFHSSGQQQKVYNWH